MSAKNESIVRSMVDAIRNADKAKTSPYDTTATVRRVETGVAWVHIPGGVDETPVKLTIAAKPGDTVQVRVSGGRAFLVGNASAPPTDDRTANAIGQNLTKRIDKTNGVLNGVRKVVESVRKIAANTNQYFWHTETGTDTGAHITEIPQEDFLRDPEHGGGNLLARSNGIAVRDGLKELAKFSAEGIALGEDDAVIIAPSGATKTVWETDSLGQHSLPSTIDLSTSDLYIALPDGGGFGLNVDVTGIGVVSATFEKGVARDITILPIRIIYDGNHGLTISSESSQYTWITVIIFARIEKTGGILSFGQRSPDFAKGAFSATFGEGLIASAENQAVFGSYNEDDPSKILIVGGGFVHTSGSTIRENVFTVDKQGNVECNNIGATVSASASKTIDTAGIDTYTEGPSVTLDAGVWVVTGQWVFNTGSTVAARNMGVQLSPNAGSTASGAYKMVRVKAADNSFASLEITDIIILTASTTVYLKGASSMTYTTAAGTTIKAVRIK